MADTFLVTFDETMVRVYRDVPAGNRSRRELVDSLEIAVASACRAHAESPRSRPRRGLFGMPAPLIGDGPWAGRRDRDRRLADTIAGFVEYVLCGTPPPAWSCLASEDLRRLVLDRLDPDLVVELIPLDSRGPTPTAAGREFATGALAPVSRPGVSADVTG